MITSVVAVTYGSEMSIEPGAIHPQTTCDRVAHKLNSRPRTLWVQITDRTNARTPRRGALRVLIHPLSHVVMEAMSVAPHACTTEVRITHIKKARK